MTFDLNALTTFVLAAEELNFTTVADKRHTVQSAVSAQIRKLEEVLGKPLLHRGRGQTMRLTPEGEAFLVYARRILALSEQAIETVQTAQARQILRLGTTVTLAMSVVPRVLTHFSAERPDVQIQIQCDRSDRLLKALADGEVDLAFMMDQGRTDARRFVHSQPLDWVCGPGFRMPETGTVPLAFLTDGRDLRRYALAALDEQGRSGFISHLSPHPIGVRAFVQAGLSLTVMPRVTVTDPLRTAPARHGLPQLAPIALAAYIDRQTRTAASELLLRLLEEAVH